MAVWTAVLVVELLFLGFRTSHQTWPPCSVHKAMTKMTIFCNSNDNNLVAIGQNVLDKFDVEGSLGNGNQLAAWNQNAQFWGMVSKLFCGSSHDRQFDQISCCKLGGFYS